MKATLTFKINLLTWAIALLLTILPLLTGKPMEQIAVNIIGTLYWMGIYYLFFQLVVPAYLVRGRLTEFFGVGIATILVAPLLGYYLLYLSKLLLEDGFGSFSSFYSLALHISGVKAMMMAAIYGSLMKLIVVWDRRKASIE